MTTFSDPVNPLISRQDPLHQNGNNRKLQQLQQLPHLQHLQQLAACLKMGKTFQKVHCSMVGRFEGGIGDKIPQWIRANGGQFSRDVDPRVTHLITTEEAYKENGTLSRMPQDMCESDKLMSHSSEC